MQELKYNRQKAYEYSKKWALKRNPKYYDFDNVGGDCTSFVSQCIYAGSGYMNYTPNLGWYYINGNKKSPSWSGVEFLYDFLIKNKGVGPYGKDIINKILRNSLFFLNKIYVILIPEKGREKCTIF